MFIFIISALFLKQQNIHVLVEAPVSLNFLLIVASTSHTKQTFICWNNWRVVLFVWYLLVSPNAESTTTKNKTKRKSTWRGFPWGKFLQVSSPSLVQPCGIPPNLQRWGRKRELGQEKGITRPFRQPESTVMGLWWRGSYRDSGARAWGGRPWLINYCPYRHSQEKKQTLLTIIFTVNILHTLQWRAVLNVSSSSSCNFFLIFRMEKNGKDDSLVMHETRGNLHT